MSSSILFPNPNKLNQKSCFIRNQQVRILLRRSISSSSSFSSHCLSFNNPQLIPKLIRVSASSTLSTATDENVDENEKKNNHPRFSDLIVALFAMGLSISKLSAAAAANSIQGAQVSNVGVGPLFFAAISDQQQQRVHVYGMHKFYNSYNWLVVIRVVLSWFPNIPWDFCVLSVLKEITDPYLDLFRDKIPPISILGRTVDVSPYVAIAVSTCFAYFAMRPFI
ncbi:Ylmg-like protein [Thalictrum thalictroides]|uniref:Ylmg-like protein n=1 Tax=Thalictrum thalictroides TaxID=46969 RepID=A0A7J6WID0_THATH|nr:Ylmg-like protein [Thalictrum thalictroides]